MPLLISRSMSTPNVFPGELVTLSAEVVRLFPGQVVAAETRKAGEPSLLLASEIDQVRGASRKRVEEFAAGRTCARRALKELGIENFPLLICEDRRPSWPDGIAGSITHTNGYCAAVVARKSHCGAIGLDAEVISGVTPDLYPYMCTAEEHGRLSTMDSAMGNKTAALISPAKEAFYKCQYTLTEEFLEFQDIQLDMATLDFAKGRCKLQPTREILLTRYLASPYDGRFYFSQDLIFSGFQFA